MAQTGPASLCLVLFLAIFAGMGLWTGAEAQAGWLQFLNSCKSDMTFSNLVRFTNNTDSSSFDISLPLGTAWRYAVTGGTSDTISAFKMTNSSGSYDQEILSWADYPSAALPVSCAPSCYWVINEDGFSVADFSNGGQLHFVASWHGPQ